MSSDGTSQLINSRALLAVAWSPDGSKLEVSSYDQTGIYVINPDGSDFRSITNPSANDAFDVQFDTHPSWSLDGSRITFSRYAGCNIELVDCKSSQIWTVNADGSNPALLTDGLFTR
jgi:Tol biopolymer transport system component